MRSRIERRELLTIARRHARGRADAEDLLQDALVAALSAGRSGEAADRAWLSGVMRNLARMHARSSGRRRRREALSLVTAATVADPTEPESHLPLDGLPRGHRLVAALALSGHTRGEIRYLLGISDEALRQRIMIVRRHFTARTETLPASLPGLAGPLAYGTIRRGLLPIARRLETGLATHDPDGHPIAFGKFAPPPHAIAPGGNRPA